MPGREEEGESRWEKPVLPSSIWVLLSLQVWALSSERPSLSTCSVVWVTTSLPNPPPSHLPPLGLRLFSPASQDAIKHWHICLFTSLFIFCLPLRIEAAWTAACLVHSCTPST